MKESEPSLNPDYDAAMAAAGEIVGKQIDDIDEAIYVLRGEEAQLSRRWADLAGETYARGVKGGRGTAISNEIPPEAKEILEKIKIIKSHLRALGQGQK